MTWYEVPSKDDGTGLREIDFGAYQPTQDWYGCQIGQGSSAVFYVLSNETMPFPTKTDSEVQAQGLDPNRTVSGA